MNNRIFTLVLVALLAVLAGIGILSVKSKTNYMAELLNQQTMMRESQQRLEQLLSRGGAQPGDMTQILVRLQDIEGRLSKFEAITQAPPAQARPQAAMPPQEDFTTVNDIPVAHTPVIGKKEAKVTIVEFLDFQCPFCARFHEPVLEVLKAYPNDVNYVLKNFPLSFHPQAKPAAKAALAAAEQGKYREMVDLLLQNGTSLSEDKFLELAQSIGLNKDKFLKDYKGKDAQWEQIIQDDITLGGKVGVNGTPTFYINGRKTMARDFNSFKTEIDAILKK